MNLEDLHMNKQEEKIARLIFNEMAFESATKNFEKEPPDLDMGLLSKSEAWESR